jgi:hypothetical protein
MLMYLPHRTVNLAGQLFFAEVHLCNSNVEGWRHTKSYVSGRACRYVCVEFIGLNIGWTNTLQIRALIPQTVHHLEVLIFCKPRYGQGQCFGSCPAPDVIVPRA